MQTPPHLLTFQMGWREDKEEEAAETIQKQKLNSQDQSENKPKSCLSLKKKKLALLRREKKEQI